MLYTIYTAARIIRLGKLNEKSECVFFLHFILYCTRFYVLIGTLTGNKETMKKKNNKNNKINKYLKKHSVLCSRYILSGSSSVRF